MAVLIAFGTVEGQSQKIAQHLRKLVLEAGQEVCLVNTSDANAEPDWQAIDTVMLVASVHERRHPKAFETFLGANQEQINARHALLISVSLRGAFPEGQEDAQAYLDEMKMRTGIHPSKELLVAGAIRSESYDQYASQALKHVVLRGFDFDPAAVQDHEFTDWDRLTADCQAFLRSRS